MFAQVKESLSYLEVVSIRSKLNSDKIDDQSDKKIRKWLRLSDYFKKSSLEYHAELVQKYPCLKDNCSILSLTEWINIIQESKDKQIKIINSIFRPDIQKQLYNLSDYELAWFIYILRAGFQQQSTFQEYINFNLRGIIKESRGMKFNTGKLMFLDERLYHDNISCEKLAHIILELKSLYQNQQKVMIKIEEDNKEKDKEKEKEKEEEKDREKEKENDYFLINVNKIQKNIHNIVYTVDEDKNEITQRVNRPRLIQENIKEQQEFNEIYKIYQTTLMNYPQHNQPQQTSPYSYSNQPPQQVRSFSEYKRSNSFRLSNNQGVPQSQQPPIITQQSTYQSQFNANQQIPSQFNGSIKDYSPQRQSQLQQYSSNSQIKEYVTLRQSQLQYQVKDYSPQSQSQLQQYQPYDQTRRSYSQTNLRSSQINYEKPSQLNYEQQQQQYFQPPQQQQSRLQPVHYQIEDQTKWAPRRSRMSERNGENERRLQHTNLFSDLGFMDKIKYAFGCLARTKNY